MNTHRSDWLDVFLREAKRLLSVYETARVDFFVFLRKSEGALPWAAGGFETYEKFLDANDVKRPASYKNFCAAVDRFGEEEVRAIGIDAALALLRAPSAEKEEQARAHFDAWVEENGKPVPSQTAQRLMDRYAPPANTPRVLANRSEVVILREENARLKRELREAKKKIRELEAQLGKKAA